ncbi:MAG: transcription-repair coupling factor, partial [Bryobacteraceae bacterium]
MTHPAIAIRDLLQELGRHPAFQELLTRVERETAPHIALSGLNLTARALYTALLWYATERPILLVVDGPKQAEALGETIETFFHLLSTGRASSQPQILPELDVLPYQHLSPHSEVSEERAVGLWRLASGRAPITVTPLGSALLKIEAGEFYRQLALTLRVGDEVPFDMVIEHLRSVGYEYREPVEMVGEYSVRGGILDVFSPEDSKPVRIEFLGDQVESMRRFDVETQRSAFKTEDCTLLPLLETPKSA